VTAEQVRKEIAASAKTKLEADEGSQEAETRGTASSERGGEKKSNSQILRVRRELISKIHQSRLLSSAGGKVDPADAEYQEIGRKENIQQRKLGVTGKEKSFILHSTRLPTGKPTEKQCNFNKNND